MTRQMASEDSAAIFFGCQRELEAFGPMLKEALGRLSARALLGGAAGATIGGTEGYARAKAKPEDEQHVLRDTLIGAGAGTGLGAAAGALAHHAVGDVWKTRELRKHLEESVKHAFTVVPTFGAGTGSNKTKFDNPNYFGELKSRPALKKESAVVKAASILETMLTSYDHEEIQNAVKRAFAESQYSAGTDMGPLNARNNQNYPAPLRIPALKRQGQEKQALALNAQAAKTVGTPSTFGSMKPALPTAKGPSINQQVGPKGFGTGTALPGATKPQSSLAKFTPGGS